MLNIIVTSIVPVYIVMALGYLAGWTRDVDNRHVYALNSLVVDYAVPASLFVATVQTPSTVLAKQGILVVILATGMLVVFGIVIFLQRRVFSRGLQEAAVIAAIVASPNLVAVGIPLTISVFGEEHRASAAITIAVASALMVPLTLIFLELGSQMPDRGRLAHIIAAVGRAIAKPLVIAPVLGVGLSFAHTGLPEAVLASLTIIGASSSGVALFIAGLLLSSQPFKLNANVALGTVLKNIAQPLIAALLVVLLAPPAELAREAIVLMSVPAGIFGILLGLSYSVVSPLAGSMFLASSILGIVTLAASIFITGGP